MHLTDFRIEFQAFAISDGNIRFLNLSFFRRSFLIDRLGLIELRMRYDPAAPSLILISLLL